MKTKRKTCIRRWLLLAVLATGAGCAYAGGYLFVQNAAHGWMQPLPLAGTLLGAYLSTEAAWCLAQKDGALLALLARWEERRL